MHPAFLKNSDAPLVGFGDIGQSNIMIISVIAIANTNAQKSHHMCTHTVLI